MDWNVRCSSGISFIICAVLAGATECLGQPSELLRKKVNFEQLPEIHGLSQRSVNCILQDADGYLWIGTWAGLIRYDGYSTTVFHAGQGQGKLKSNKITSLYEDHRGNLWVGTHMGGVFQYDRKQNQFRHFAHNEANPESLSNNNVWSIQGDQYGNLWVGTEHGLNVFDGEHDKFRVFYNDPADQRSLSQNFVTDLFLSSQNELWISTQHGINRLVPSAAGQGYAFEKYLYSSRQDDYDLHNYVYQIDETVIGDKSLIWYSTKKGLKRLESGVVKSFVVSNSPSANASALSLLAVKGEKPFILLGSETGLHFFDPGKEAFTKSLDNHEDTGNLNHSAISALYLDRGGVLWAGTKKGLNKYDTFSKTFEAHKTASFDKGRNIISGIQGSSQGGYWLSTVGGGLFLFRDNEFRHFSIDDRNNAFTNFVQTLFTDTKGDVWVGTAGAGIYRISEKKLSGKRTIITEFDHFHLHSSSPVSDDFIMAIEEDSRGNIWVGTWSGGLNKITPDGKVVQYRQPELRNAPLVTIHADLSDILWIGTRGNGLYRVKVRDQGPEIYIYKQGADPSTSVASNFINSIFEDHAGKFWISTEEGLNTFDRRTEEFSSVAINDATGNPSIAGILEDDDGKVWLAHADGLTVIDPLDSTHSKTYEHHDRILGGFHYNNACYKDFNGRLLFAGSDGLNIIDPEVVVVNPTKSPVVIQNFEVFNEAILPGTPFNGRVLLEDPLPQTNEIRLKHSENTISFEFSALDFAAPEKIYYAYMLEGFDSDWNYTNASRRYANYTNLDYGKYSFKVKATNNDGIWNGDIAAVTIFIQPPWWMTVWAFMLFGSMALLVLYGFRKLILMRANLIHNIKLERLQRENMENLNRAKLEFFTNISHEFRTPLTLILGPVQNLIDSAGGNKFIRDQLVLIHNNAQRLLRLINELLDFRKAETGNLKLEVAEGNLVKFIKEIKLSFDSLAEQLKIDFTFSASSNIITAWFDRDQFEKIMFNLLSNAFKHTPENGKVSIRIIENNKEILIAVEDSGKGIKPEYFDTIFQSFFSYDEDHRHNGTGIGLALTKSLVDAHHGSIAVTRVENQYTRFTVRLPSGNAHFDKSELVTRFRDSEQIERYPKLTPESLPDSQDLVEQMLRPAEDQHKLLVVEDNAEVRAYIKSVFQGKFIILEAEEGKEGFSLALEEIPDVIISDIMMPVMDGISMTRQLKSNVKTSHIPVILLTARTSLIFKVEGLETGADDYVSKPFNPKVLQLKVRNLIRTRVQLGKMFSDKEVLTIEPSRVTLTSADEVFVEKILKSIETNMSNTEYSVEELGSDVGMSRMQLYRKLKALTGQSANEFIRTLRLKRAAQLMEQNQLTIAEITYEVGFNDLQYFRECFKKYFGVTPSEYAQKFTRNPIQN